MKVSEVHFCCRHKGEKQFLIELIDFSQFLLFLYLLLFFHMLDKKFMIIVYRFYYVYDNISPNVYPHIFIFTFLFFSCDFQISISFMSQKCQNLLPLKSIASKGIGEAKRRKSKHIFRWYSFLPFPSAAHTSYTWDGKNYPKLFFSNKHYVEFYVVTEFLAFRVSSSPFLSIVKILIILLRRHDREKKRCKNFSSFSGLCHRLSKRRNGFYFSPPRRRNWVDFVLNIALLDFIEKYFWIGKLFVESRSRCIYN